MLKHIAKFLHGEKEGSVTIIFSLSLVMLMLSVGLAVDYSRAIGFYDRTQQALDAAALAAAKAAASGADEAEQQILAQRFFDQAMQGQAKIDAALGKLRLKYDADTSELEVGVDSEVRTVVGKLIGIDSMSKTQNSAAFASGRDVELAIMLDVSGSMKGDKLRDLKLAAADLFDTMFKGASEKRQVRIGLVPYATSVNGGQFAEKARGKALGHDKKERCLTERKGNHAFKDTPPSNGNAFGHRTDDCPDAELMALSDDKAALLEAIDDLEADGATAGHLGIAWAWYMVSEKWDQFWPSESAPSPSDPAKLVKAVVLMTDGMFNRSYEDDNGSSAQQARKLCASMKAEGITVFTVAFDAPAEVLPIFAECASTNSYAMTASSGGQLKTSFTKIAAYLNDLRVAR